MDEELTYAQVAIPVFDRLLPEPHNTKIMKMLFTLAHWHGLAKLRMHTDATLAVLEEVTRDVGKTLRDFQKTTCAAYETKELSLEVRARTRRAQDAAARNKGVAAVRGMSIYQSIYFILLRSTARKPVKTTKASKKGKEVLRDCSPNTGKAVPRSGRRPKKFNLNTVKLHFLGDYTPTIRGYGTTDSYSTETVGNTISRWAYFSHHRPDGIVTSRF